MLSDRTSSLSFASKVVTSAKEEINFEEMSDEQLRSTLEEAMCTNRTLTLENEVFERYLRRRDPQCLRKLSYVMESARQAQKLSCLQSTQPHDPGSRVGSTPSLQSLAGAKTSTVTTALSGQLARSTASGSRQFSTTGGMPNRAAKGLKITVAHRIELATKEIEEMRKKYENFEKSIIRRKGSLEARLEEVKYRIKESKDNAERFENEVLNQADPITKQISMETFIRFMEHQLKLVETINDKLNLKIVTTKRLIRQTKKQICQREELGKTLRPIDFEKLGIENKYLTVEIEKHNRSITTLKQMSGHYNLTLKNYKDRLLERRSKLQSIETELAAKKREKVDLRRSQIKATREISKAQDQLNHFKELQDEYEIPEVEDFLNVQRQLQEVKKKFKRLIRRRKLQLFTLKSCRKTS